MFDKLIHDYQTDLKNYCRMLTGTPWDAEDLYQDTLLKSFQFKEKLNAHPNPKAYMLRVASTTWMDHCRKKKVVLDMDEHSMTQIPTHDNDPIVLDEMVEGLASSLPPKQAAVLLLIEVFHFTSKETAGMLNTSVGSVKAVLHRARKNVKNLIEREKNEETTMEWIQVFQQAIRHNDPTRISTAYRRLTQAGFSIAYDKEKQSFTIEDPEGNILGMIQR
ncbi:RNA polymerase sigma factor [Pseudalkalibacillus sp. Hm43]|uniref:RNA polymerase sigma factor n=1 Tax=Pseudalkalibacillus sp. Hm43 TaxID=3450742 RepID=UPI003F42D00E